jgi:hypothetical protein
MHAPQPYSTSARRELVVAVMLVVALSMLVPVEDAFLVAGLLPVAVLIAGIAILGGDQASSRPYEALLLPAVLAGGAAAAIHLITPGLWMLLAIVLLAALLDRILALEIRIQAQTGSPDEADRPRVLLLAIVVLFIAFTGMAALVPGGLAEPGGNVVPGNPQLSEGWLLVMALDDALIALILGYRVAAFRYGAAGAAARSAVTYAIVVAAAAGAVRAMDLPRLVAPAVLTLVFYLWDTLHGTPSGRRREPRFLWETFLLAILVIVVVAWNLRLRG